MSIDNNCFPDDLKFTEVSPVFKKKDDLDKEIIDLSVFYLMCQRSSKELCSHQQIEDFMKDELSNLLTGFRKNHNTQHCLMSMLEKWKKTLDKGGYICAIFMDLSKAFDTLNHKLLIAKLGAYGFDTKALYYIKSYLDNRKQRVRVNSNFSSWQEVIAGVRQGSILGPLLFNIFVNDIFLFVSSSNLSNYADNTLYTSGYNLEEVKEVLLNDLTKVTEWYFKNYVILNAGKCHFIYLGKNREK